MTSMILYHDIDNTKNAQQNDENQIVFQNFWIEIYLSLSIAIITCSQEWDILFYSSNPGHWPKEKEETLS